MNHEIQNKINTQTVGSINFAGGHNLPGSKFGCVGVEYLIKS